MSQRTELYVMTGLALIMSAAQTEPLYVLSKYQHSRAALTAFNISNKLYNFSPVIACFKLKQFHFSSLTNTFDPRLVVIKLF